MSGFLDKKERVFDIVLTDLGRKLLSENQLEFVHYAFSDSGVDYSGSIDMVSKTTGTLDDFVFRNLAFEANQEKDSLKDKTLDTWLFTIPANSPVVPEFKPSLTGSMTLNRRYKVEKVVKVIEQAISNPTARVFAVSPLDIILGASIPNQAQAPRAHVYAQKLANDIKAEVETKVEKKPTAPSFLTKKVKKIIAEIKRVTAMSPFAFPPLLSKSTKLAILKHEYKDKTNGRNYDNDLKNGIIP